MVVKHTGEIGQRQKQLARWVAAAAANFPLDGGGGGRCCFAKLAGIGRERAGLS